MKKKFDKQEYDNNYRKKNYRRFTLLLPNSNDDLITFLKAKKIKTHI